MLITETPERRIWVDIARGLGIIAVVLGHSELGNPSRYIFWFHMPVFFALSGYLFKPCANWMEFKKMIGKDTRQLLLPYISFLVLVTVCKYAWVYCNGSAGSIHFVEDLINFIVGGRFLKGWYAPFWFVTCLYTTKIVFAYIQLQFSSDRIRLIVIACAYLLAHGEAHGDAFRQAFIPGNIDVTLIAVTYFAFGYYAKYILEKRNLKVLIISVLVSASFVISQYFGIIDYRLDLKYLAYNNVILDLLIPLFMTVGICQISHFLESIKAIHSLAEIGQRSLSIMYLHIPVNRMIQETAGYGFAVFTLLGVILPYFVSKYLLERFEITRNIFLGKQKKKLIVKQSGYRIES